MTKTLARLLSAILMTVVIISCSGNTGKESVGTMQHAQYLDIQDLEGYTVVEITNPWDTTRILHRYILVPEEAQVPADIPQGTLIRTPIDKIIVYSSVHASILDALGATGRISGVCEPEYMTSRTILEGIEKGRIIDCGSSMSPSIERIAQAGGRIIIASPFENSGYGTAGKLGIPIVEAADYMERTPLGRTEWVKLFGALLGCPEKADSLFNAAASDYNAIKSKVINHLRDSALRPTLIAERKYGASWDVPGGASYMARIYRDAGADYIFGDNTSESNINMSFENVLSKGIDADLWVLKYWSPEPMTYTSLEAEYSQYSKFRAFREHRVYGCNTGSSTYYDDIVLHPDWILEDLAAIFHPDIFPDKTPRYFFPLAE